MKKILIITYGFLGDILFASSIAEKLHEKYEEVEVDYIIGFPQPLKLLQNSPFTNKVYLSETKGPRVQLPEDLDISLYNHIYELPELLHDTTPTERYQEYCEIEKTSSEYKIYTDPSFDQAVQYEFKIANPDNVKVVGYVANWKNSSIKYTEEEYDRGLRNVDSILTHTHNTTRDIEYILKELGKEFILIPLGFDAGVSQYHGSLDATANYTNQASIIKYCDIVIGQEGGITNLAAGVGTRCIITTDFMHALYGPKGIMRQLVEVKLGPKNLFPNSKHIHLSPFVSDEEIVEAIRQLL